VPSPEKIEQALGSRLIPRGFRDAGRESVHAMLDELAAESPQPGRRIRQGLAWSAAAAVLALACLAWWPTGETAAPLADAVRPVDDVQLLSESVGVVAAEQDADWHTDAEGNFMQTWHLQVIDEQLFHDGETGHEVRVIHPRNEVVLLPISTF
jgi:hypothetical protein